MINVVVPMAGAGSRFSEAGYAKPKPFIDVAGQTMIARVLGGLQVPGARYTLIIQEAFRQSAASDLADLAGAFPVSFLAVEKLTQGAAATALAAHRIIDGDSPVLFADSDNLFAPGVIASFVADASARGLDGSLLTFKAGDAKFSFAHLDAEGFVRRTTEKTDPSDHAIAGAYFFARGSDFVNAATDLLIYGDRTGGEFYMSSVFNRAIAGGAKVGIRDIADSDWCCLGTPELLDMYLQKGETL
ncbi:glycosyl transferase family 2 [Alphaproteobacteria bacterium]|nr:glycosyl transferase family 2 [Alphaproteobacteria bacterium]